MIYGIKIIAGLLLYESPASIKGSSNENKFYIGFIEPKS